MAPRSRGSLATGVKAGAVRARQQPKVLLSRARVQAYDPCTRTPRAGVASTSTTADCWVPRPADSSDSTRPSNGDTAASRTLASPVAGGMDAAGTYTPRPPSDAIVNAGVARRLRSR